MLTQRRLLLVPTLILTAGIGSTVSGQTSDFREAAVAINDAIRAHHYNPAELDTDAYRQIEQETLALGEKASSADEFMDGFNAIWQKGPFSHVGLQKAQESAADRIAHLDTLIVGPDAVKLEWRASTAILTVNTMIGADTNTAINWTISSVEAHPISWVGDHLIS